MKTTKSQIYQESTDFFRNLTQKFDDYFLSDYVECRGEFPDEVTDEEHDKIVKRLNYLKDQCIIHDIDLHLISCEVGKEWLIDNGIIHE